MADQTFAVHCGFFDAINSDRTYSADEMNRPYKRVISNGVFATPNGTPSTDLQVTASSGMSIICKKGEGLFGDKWFENPSGIAITVPSNTGTVPRIDSVIVQVDTRTSGRVGNIVHRTGTPASNPTPPAINQVEGVKEYRLANIRVNAGVSAITQSMITDRRGSSDCPWVTSLIYQVDTSTLYDQWQAAYAEYFEEEKAIWDAWYAQLTEDLDVSMTLDRHVNTVTTTAQTTGTIPIGLVYNHNTDILEVYINGLRAIEGTHYVVVNDDTSIQVENQLDIGQTVTFVVMRSVISGSATNITVLLQELESQIAGIAGGTPTVVDSVSDMTDTEKIYILSSDSKWYYYSSTAEDWVIGGTYGGVPTDTTLTQQGKAADAKATGDALADKADADDVTAIDDRVTAVEGDVSDLESAITDFQLIMTTGQYVNYDVGILSSDLWAISNNFPLTKGLAVKVTTNIYNTAAIGFFDSDDNYIGGIKSSEGGAVREYTVEDFPSKTAYMRVSCLNSDKDKVKIDIIDLYGKIADFFYSNNNDYVETAKNSDVIDGKFVKADGTEAITESWECTDYLPVIPESTVSINCVCYGNGATCFYDEDKNVVLGIDGHNVEEYGGTSSYRPQILNITLPENAKFVRFSAMKTYARVTSLYIQYNLPWNEYSFDLITKVSQFEAVTDKYYTERKILVFGDSISADAYGNYKKWVTNLIDEGKFNLVNTTNSSQHATGFVARYNNQPNDFISRMESITNKGDYDLVIVFGGINDYIRGIPLGGEAGQTDITTYFKPAVDYFFNYLINNFTQARICVLTPLRTSNTTPNSAGNKQEVYADYIRSVAQSYCLPILDLTVESGFCPFVPAFKNRWTLIPSGYTDPDGVHPIAEYEKKYLAPMIWKFLNGLLLE